MEAVEIRFFFGGGDEDSLEDDANAFKASSDVADGVTVDDLQSNTVAEPLSKYSERSASKFGPISKVVLVVSFSLESAAHVNV